MKHKLNFIATLVIILGLGLSASTAQACEIVFDRLISIERLYASSSSTGTITVKGTLNEEERTVFLSSIDTADSRHKSIVEYCEKIAAFVMIDQAKYQLSLSNGFPSCTGADESFSLSSGFVICRLQIR